MSEEPVPYEPIDLNEEALKQRMGTAEKLRIDVLTGRKAERERAEMLRIEALRAAAQVTAGALASGKPLLGGDPAVLAERPASEATIKLADQFVRWLETGERS